MTSSTEAGTSDKKSKVNFSIDHILNQAGTSKNQESFEENSSTKIGVFPWLQCTRYCPPKIQRYQKREGTPRRQLGRHPRIPFTSHQLAVLEEKFRQSPYLSSADVLKISRTLQLADIRVKIWFQNRRARDRREKSQLETEHKSWINLTEESIQIPKYLEDINASSNHVWTPTITNSNFSNCTTTSIDSYLEHFTKSRSKDSCT
ncbi:hypothetical protein FQA39_LY13798 [Lamprigera yunnana]|nr:hypothetical protein FQA39_LY13798 [Lamprigera yunnana]